jgi:predicted acetyltransferase
MPFQFLDPGPLIDRELQLIVPEARWTDELLRTCAHPTGRGDPTAKTTRQQIDEYLRAAPSGHFIRETASGQIPQYLFWMRLRPEYQTGIVIAGSISLRIGDNQDLRMYLGHIGYNVYPAARGNHYAARACKLLFHLAERHGLRELWITCNPENIASRKTCDHLGMSYVETVNLPADHILYQRGERQKCRYRIDLPVIVSG